jgi:hypothetical protein
MGGYGVGGGLGGVDDGEWMVHGGEGSKDGGLKEGVVGAAEEEGLGGRRGGQGFGQVNAQDFVGDGVVGPALFYQRDEEGAGFLVGFKAEGVECVGVGVGLDGGGGGEDQDVVLGRGFLQVSDDEAVANMGSGEIVLWRFGWQW